MGLSASQVQPTPDVCPDKRRLADEIRTVMDQILTINTRQFKAVIGGDFDEADSLDKQLAAARQRKDKALEAYKRHLTSHGC